MELLEDGLSGQSQESSAFNMYLGHAEIQLVCHIHMWEWMLLSCHAVSFAYDKWVICQVSSFVQMVAAAVDSL